MRKGGQWERLSRRRRDTSLLRHEDSREAYSRNRSGMGGKEKGWEGWSYDCPIFMRGRNSKEKTSVRIGTRKNRRGERKASGLIVSSK